MRLEDVDVVDLGVAPNRKNNLEMGSGKYGLIVLG